MEAADAIRKWYAIYTKPRWEKKANRLLQEKGIESYCPLNKVYRKWSDRMKVVEEPLFKSYIFVRVTEEEKVPVRMTAGVMNFVYWLGNPAIVKDKEIETIKLFLENYREIEVIPVTLKPGQEISIPSGIFMGERARVENVKKNYVIVTIKSLGYQLKARLQHVKAQRSKK
ncbi:UpxY family transcription antiterminator [Pseudobacter ginsenosidimutans]|uniref:Transcription antitermination factor NusG n=1 Tax=Pseudobacter ginsenosidimutans TaxID=661488 RepID=A0A4Q7MVY5_9BACT|nr:UpxY family transcription antiterminator [Pseudobacter ginsenosidimutans]QEC41054.1 UpxY family transcription antiterminator [Pseudobacter ginsenosidimutans]RZS72194.1 transcription antitermination factor NusG [Pseudobacter ginsenosidimutans]